VTAELPDKAMRAVLFLVTNSYVAGDGGRRGLSRLLWAQGRPSIWSTGA
jgi:hypothetical protein